MQTTKNILLSDAKNLIELIFREGVLHVYRATNYDGDPVVFKTADDLFIEIHKTTSQSTPFCNFVIYYPETEGYLKKEIIRYAPGISQFQYSTSMTGWGLIQLQISANADTLECRVAVNSEKRTASWTSHYPELKDPALWNWKLVERHARRIINGLKKFSD